MERLQKVIAASGLTSRRKAEELISQGRVKVNGETVSELGQKVAANAEITVDDLPLSKPTLCYFLLNKPKKTICSVVDQFARPTVVDLIDSPVKIVPVGRLDYDTTGLIILTNDGSFVQEMTHPSYQVTKTYEVSVNGICTPLQIKKLEKGLLLDDGKLSHPAKVKVLNKDVKKNNSTLEIVIHEGRNHQIKMMIEAIGFTVKRLHRSAIGDLNCDKLAIGSYRLLKPYEIKKLRALASEGKSR